MICYYRNGISYGANRMESEDQIVIRGKLDQIRIRPIKVSHFRDFWRGHFVKRERKREMKRRRRRRRRRRISERKPRKVWISMDCMDLYGLLWFCMDISLFHF